MTLQRFHFAVLGATGRTGGAVARRLLAADARVRAIGRDARRLAPLAALGAEPWVSDCTDVAGMAAAFTGVDAIYAMSPFDPALPDYRTVQERQTAALAAAVRHGGVRRAVFLSSIGADEPDGTGVIAALHRAERELHAITDLDLLCLRPGAFFEGLFAHLPAIRAAGVFADAIAPDLPVPMLAADDVAAVAAAALLDPSWHGRLVRELPGERDLTHREIGEGIAAVLGLPRLAYRQVPYDAYAAMLAGAGVAPDVAAELAGFARALNERRIVPRAPRASRPPAGLAAWTPFAAFLPRLKAAYAAADDVALSR